ncbi:STAS/SEC14 domain-containing protein [Arthrobacter cheniae]|uniref:STAS/SEC14 domain-containing protein n=1 Tax=Arthrobacter cheniae TaxID=1258888 RepID=A0A3A5M941_9MICC|nr:STAS/SEC14 domain-containing protein [Arthrobacter cheniae]RJT75124.1 STAS/SEC14 domain-containing protein [Arthrobacter cheniae]
MVLFEASREEDFLCLRWGPGAHDTYADAVEAALALSTLPGSKPAPLLVHITGIASVSIGARTGMLAYRGFPRVAVVGEKPMDEMLAAFAARASMPVRYFTMELIALEWLFRRG